MSLSRLSRLSRPLVEVAAAAFIALAVAFVAALWVLPKTGQAKSLNVLTGSMSPTIPQGSMVLIRPVAPAQLGVGDIITFRSPSNPAVLVTHRVSGLVFGGDDSAQLSFRTRGDANAGDDIEAVPAGAVVGRVAFHAPHVGSLSAWLHTPTGFGLLAGMILLLAFGPKLKQTFTSASPRVEEATSNA